MVKDQGAGAFWIDHAEIVLDDLSWLVPAERLTLWNVVVPGGLLAQLSMLWWLDLRGGSAADLECARGCERLRYLQVNQVRGMCDLDLVQLGSSTRTNGSTAMPMHDGRARKSAEFSHTVVHGDGVAELRNASNRSRHS